MAWRGLLDRLNTRRRMAAAGLLGAVASFALPPFHLVPLLLVAVPGLLGLLRGATWRRAAWVGFWFGFGLHFVGLYWITDAILLEADRFWWLIPLAVPALAAVLAVFVALPCALAVLAPPGLARVAVLAGAWTLADLARQFVLSGFPWNPLGSVWAAPGPAGTIMLQPASVIGVHGLTLATLWLATTPALGRRVLIAGAVLLAVWAGAGAWRIAEPPPSATGVSVVLVQGNVPQDFRWDRATVLARFETQLALTRQGVAGLHGPGVVVWSETASPFLLETDAAARAAIAEAAGPGTIGLIGSVRFDEARRPRNSLMAITGAGPPAAIYDKAHLVPFGEYQPGWMPLPIRLVPGDGFAAGPGPRSFHVPGLPPVGPLICYEAIFPAAVADAADRPQWLVNITNDAWFGDSTGPRQHLAAARMRAVEEGLPLMRAANSGISAGFDAYGRELGRLGINTQGVLVLDLPGSLPPTPFARLGLAIPLALALASTVLGFGLAIRRRVRLQTGKALIS